ncbi:MAG: PAS domain-containing protein [Polyangiales bacterium]
MRSDRDGLSLDPGLADELLELLPVGVMLWRLARSEDDTSLTLAYHNRAASALSGVALDALRECTFAEVFGAVPGLDAIATIAATARDGAPRTLGRFTTCGGDDGQRIIGARVIAASGGAMVLLEHADPLVRAEREARSIGRLVDSIVEHLPAMVFVKDAASLRLQRVNRAGEALLGEPRAALLGKTDVDLFPPEQAALFSSDDREVLNSRVLKDIPREPIETRSGTRWLHTRKIPILDECGEPSHLLGVSIDVTDQKRAEEVLRSSHDALEQHVRDRNAELALQISQRTRTEETLARTEEQLRHTQKMESIGRLAGGVAHDFNNLLSVVVGYSDLLLSQIPEHAPLRKHVEQISQAGARAANLTRQLLTFSRRQALRPRIIDLNQVLTGLEEMLSRLVGEHIEVTIRRSAAPVFIEADQSQIEQVVMNLVVNARDAMPSGGRLDIETAVLDLDAAFVANHRGGEPGPHVRLAVRDTGIGMDPSTLQRAFESFFTTKEAGKGTGLGLATVLGIVKQRQGMVRAESAPGLGATFEVYLPLAPEAHRSLPATAVPRTHLRGTETVLLVEDQEPVRRLAATCLRELGYRVIEAGGAADAEREARAQPVQLLLTDVMMPGMTGSALAARLSRRDPALRVLFMSGHADVAAQRSELLAGRALLHKPLVPARLAQRVREVLDAPHVTTTAHGQPAPP